MWRLAFLVAILAAPPVEACRMWERPELERAVQAHTLALVRLLGGQPGPEWPPNNVGQTGSVLLTLESVKLYRGPEFDVCRVVWPWGDLRWIVREGVPTANPGSALADTSFVWGDRRNGPRIGDFYVAAIRPVDNASAPCPDAASTTHHAELLWDFCGEGAPYLFRWSADLEDRLSHLFAEELQ